MHLVLVGVGLVVGLLVGLVGMGGGALLTPLLMLVFQVSPLAAISSGLLASLVMKPVGALVHLHYRTVNWRLVCWLTLGSVPAAFTGAVIIGTIGHTPAMQAPLKLVIGIALCVSVGMTLLRQLLDRRRGAHPDQPPQIRPLRTALIGVLGGFAVGMASVGAGSLTVALLLITYPELQAAQLVGTDIVQAIPLVATATLAHLRYGDVQLALTSSLLLGALPGVYLGARFSARGPADLIRPVIAVVLLTSALALLRAPTLLLIGAPAAALVAMIMLRVPQPAAAATQPSDQ